MLITLMRLQWSSYCFTNSFGFGEIYCLCSDPIWGSNESWKNALGFLEIENQFERRVLSEHVASMLKPILMC